MSGYLSGLSSPSVTDRITTLASSPRSHSAGQTRLPTFSMNSSDWGPCPCPCPCPWSWSWSWCPCAWSCSARRAKACATMGASRWQPLPVLTWMAGTPVARMRSASCEVCWSPSITARGSSGCCCCKARMVAHSSVVLPEPGLETRLSARTPWAWKCARLCCATWLLAPSTSCSMRMARDSLSPGTDTRAAPAPKCRSPVCASTTAPPAAGVGWAGAASPLLLHPHTTHIGFFLSRPPAYPPHATRHRPGA